MPEITIKQAYEQGSLRFSFSCRRPIAREGWNGWCNHIGKVGIQTAMRRWGEDCRLDQMRARCSKCGSSEFVSVMCEPPGRLGKRGRR